MNTNGKRLLSSVSVVLAALLSFALLFFPHLSHATVKAEVDRDRIALDETLTLTISKDGTSFFSSPDNTSLEKDFRVLSNSHSSNTEYINGHMSASVRWEMVLAPKRTGKLQIPALEVAGERTEPIWVEVAKSAPPKKSTDSQETIFIETEVDHDEVQVQSQLIYTIRVYFSIQAQIQDPPTPDIPGALVEKLDDATFSKMLHGKSYKVFERKYAIFPQKSGVLEIPQTSLQITVPTRRNFGGFFDMLDQGRTYQLRGNVHSVKVLEKSKEFPADSVWLPTDNLTLGEKWSSDPGKLKVGDSTTLTIDIFGQGLLAAQLPPVVLPEIDGFKIYQNKAETDNNISTHGVVGHRTETIALIPTKPGTFDLPEIRIPWWDKKDGEVKYAVIPARKLNVTGTAVSEPANQAPEAAPAPPPAEKLPDVLPSPQQVVASGKWIVVSAVLALLLLITLFLWLRARRALAQAGKNAPRRTTQLADQEKAEQEGKMFAALKEACKTNEPNRVRAAALAWAAAHWPERSIRTVADIADVDPENDLVKQLGILDSFLYGKDRGIETWDARELLAAVAATRKNKVEKKSKGEALAPLYK